MGTIHVGDESYYDSLSRQLASFAAAGAAIHYELVSTVSDAPEEKQKILDSTHSTHEDSMSFLFSALGGVSQKKFLKFPSNAVNIDLSDLDVLHLLGERKFRKLFAPPSAPLEGDVSENADYRNLARKLLRHANLTLALSSLVPSHRSSSKVVLDMRNSLAVSAALDAPAKEVVLVWGAGHLRGMIKILKRKGFKITSLGYNDALNLA